MNETDYGFIDSVLELYGYYRHMIIAIMQDIQSEYRYLSAETISYVGQKLHMTPATLYGVASFYENFSTTPKGKYIIRICDGTACHVRKSADIQDALLEAAGMTPEDDISEDGLFSIERVSCLGACGIAPVLTVNDAVHAGMTPQKARQLIADLKEAERNEA